MVHHKQSSCRRVSLPYREDAWHQSGSSEWPRPQLQRSAGWSQGWQTGIRNKHRRCVTLCMSYMTRSDYLNVQCNQNIASHHWWSFNKIHIVLHYFKAISAQHYFARRLRSLPFILIEIILNMFDVLNQNCQHHTDGIVKKRSSKQELWSQSVIVQTVSDAPSLKF